MSPRITPAAEEREARAARELWSEKEFQAEVVAAAKLFGWRWCHFRPARRLDDTWRTAMSGHVGFPDLVLARNGRLLLVELKSQKGRISLDQQAWLAQIGFDHARLWRPSDWLEIMRELSTR